MILDPFQKIIGIGYGRRARFTHWVHGSDGYYLADAGAVQFWPYTGPRTPRPWGLWQAPSYVATHDLTTWRLVVLRRYDVDIPDPNLYGVVTASVAAGWSVAANRNWLILAVDGAGLALFRMPSPETFEAAFAAHGGPFSVHLTEAGGEIRFGDAATLALDVVIEIARPSIRAFDRGPFVAVNESAILAFDGEFIRVSAGGEVTTHTVAHANTTVRRVSLGLADILVDLYAFDGAGNHYGVWSAVAGGYLDQGDGVHGVIVDGQAAILANRGGGWSQVSGPPLPQDLVVAGICRSIPLPERSETVVYSANAAIAYRWTGAEWLPVTVANSDEPDAIFCPF